ncbi:MAG: DNA polymerase I [Ilumatobacteraceae bacterium]
MKVMALDGNSLVYRAFFALPDTMTTARGEVTNAVFGFCSMFATLLRDHSPDAVVVVFDRKEKTFRHEAAPEYKAQREKQPDTLYAQLDTVKELLAAAGVTTLECAGFEGDDIIATIAANIADNELIIVTGDRDSYQLVKDPDVRVLYNKRGVSDYALYDEAGIKERTGVTPAQYPDYAALRGDPSDNLDGVPGVGEKTAAKLITQYGSLASVFDHADEQTPKLRASLHESRERVLRNAGLMRLRADVPVATDARTWVPTPNAEALKALFGRLEFSTMGQRWAFFVARFGGGAGADGGVGTKGGASSGESSGGAPLGAGAAAVGALNVDLVSAATASEALRALGDGSSSRGLAGVWAGDAGRSPLVALVVAAASSTNSSNATATEIGMKLVTGKVADALAAGQHFVAHDGRNLLRSLLGVGIDIASLRFDTAIAAYLVDADAGAYDASHVARRWLGCDVTDSNAGTSAPEGQLDFDAVPDETASRDAAVAASVAVLAEEPLRNALTDGKVMKLYLDAELPLVRVLAKMEHRGIGVDRARLSDLEAELRARSQALVQILHAEAGREINVNSPQQLSKLLFVEKQLSPGKKTKGGKKTGQMSTDAATLEKLRDEWPKFITPLLEYREVEKLRSTYAEGLLATVEADSRIHASFNQTVARTGRLSSDRPNLHNIPVRSDAGRVFREVFVADAGHEFLVADYNQIELRCIAHLSNDAGLLEAFRAGTDIHRAVAARVFSVSPDEVTGEQRSRAKMVSYGLAYGMEAYGLSQRLAIDVSEAKEILDAYFAAFPRVKWLMDESINEARTAGYTTTLFGRRRPIPGMTDGPLFARKAAERMAMNAGIQGLAADIFKLALVAVDRALEERKLATRIVLQVHDEIILEAPKGERAVVGPLVTEQMMAAAQLAVPLVVNASWATSWAGAKVA